MLDCAEIVVDVQGQVGLLTLNRPKALNALTLPMVRALTAALVRWRDDAGIAAVAIRGMGRDGPFGSFCAGGDIRFFHQAALAGNPALEDFFTEEYALNHLIHGYPKPYLAFMDGIVMGGGMGISQGASTRIVTARSKLGMPETHIGLFPDVGGGYFLSRLVGSTGEWLALTGQALGARDAIELGLADVCLAEDRLPAAWAALAGLDWAAPDPLAPWFATYSIATEPYTTRPEGQIDAFFSLASVPEMVRALECDGSAWACQTAATLRQRSPLMLHVVLEQVRRARGLSLADDLRLERGLVRHCFHTAHLGRSGASSDTVEGIRALAVDKDHQPRWQPARIEDVTADMVAPFFVSPWPAGAHPLRELA
jgi:enoyl-CoA hydratase